MKGRKDLMDRANDRTDELYKEAREVYGTALQRLARGYEADPDKQRDLLQEIHIEIWRSFKSFDNRCSLRTWVYRVAHNVGATHILKSRRLASRLVDLDAMETEVAIVDGEEQAHQQFSVSQLLDRIHQLKPLDRQTMLLYLEGEDAGSIAEVTGLSAVNVATKIHRVKKVLSKQFREGAFHAEQ